MAARRWFPHVSLFLLAFALRAAWVLTVERDGFAFNDAIIYHDTAINLTQGNGYVPFTGGPTARWPPGYSTVLGGVYLLFGVRPLAGELLNALVGAVTVVLLMVAVQRAVGRRAAIIAGSILAVLPGPIMWTDVLVAETLYTAVFVTVFLVLVHARPTWRWALLLGVVIGAGALVRGEALTWMLLPVVLWWRAVPRIELLRLVVSTGVVVVALLSPWTIRNAVVMDAFVPLATNASQTLWSGHHPGATGGQTYPPPGYEDQFSPELPERELEVSKALRDDAIEFMLSNPRRELELIPLKLIHLNRGDSYVLDWVNAPAVGREPPLSPIAVERIGVVADAGYFGLLALTVLGGWWLGRSFWRQPAGRLIATSFLTALFLYGFLYYGNYRYRLPYEPLMVVVAATFLARIAGLRPGDDAAPGDAEPADPAHRVTDVQPADGVSMSVR
jgi:4-amino-4-deoxy-L-arabinose transferase-like glycosyltransferase